MPMIEYTLTWLESAGVDEAFVFCCAHSHQVKEYLERSGWAGKAGAGSMVVTAVESHDAISAGDALRVVYERGVVSGFSASPIADSKAFFKVLGRDCGFLFRSVLYGCHIGSFR
jgi:NDP-sugar pyrophosphorylase family protein